MANEEWRRGRQAKYLRDALAVMSGDEVRIEPQAKHPVKVLDERSRLDIHCIPVTRAELRRRLIERALFNPNRRFL